MCDSEATANSTHLSMTSQNGYPPQYLLDLLVFLAPTLACINL
jgi:hypothetical protein